ncbi:hypothetical protein DXG03_007709, partial [Asterophora parasitica]
MELGLQKAPGSSGTHTSKGPTSGKKAPGNISLKASASGKEHRHRRYAIKISGCSPAVYNVVENRAAYKKLLAHTKLFAEHPRQEEKYYNAIKRMKPFWAEDEATYG